jgi:hypothetical protein
MNKPDLLKTIGPNLSDLLKTIGPDLLRIIGKRETLLNRDIKDRKESFTKVNDLLAFGESGNPGPFVLVLDRSGGSPCSEGTAPAQNRRQRLLLSTGKGSARHKCGARPGPGGDYRPKKDLGSMAAKIVFRRGFKWEP